MNYIEFLKSSLILFKTFELFDDDLHKIVYSKKFREEKVKKLLLGIEKEWISLSDVSPDLISVGIISLDLYYDYLSDKVTEIKLESTMEYVGYINFLLESYKDDLHEVELLKFNLLSPYVEMKVFITQSSNLSIKSTFILPTYNNGVLHINYGDFKMLKYKNQFVLDFDVKELNNSVYFDLVNNRMSFNSKLSSNNLIVKFDLLEEDDCEKFFSLFTYYPSNRLLLGYKYVDYKLIINKNYLDVFKEKAKEFMESSPSYLDNINLKLFYSLDEVDEDFLSLIFELGNYFNITRVR